MAKNRIKLMVYSALKDYPYLRDSDHRLVGHIWKQQILTMNAERMQSVRRDVLSLLYSHKLTNWETISRIRRKLQQDYEELRGKKYKERRKKTTEVGMDMTDYTPTL